MLTDTISRALVFFLLCQAKFLVLTLFKTSVEFLYKTPNNNVVLFVQKPEKTEI